MVKSSQFWRRSKMVANRERSLVDRLLTSVLQRRFTDAKAEEHLSWPQFRVEGIPDRQNPESHGQISFRDHDEVIRSIHRGNEKELHEFLGKIVNSRFQELVRDSPFVAEKLRWVNRSKPPKVVILGRKNGTPTETYLFKFVQA